jgi:hypothetical protein
MARCGGDVDASLQGGRGRHAEPTLRHRRIQRSGAAQHRRGKQPDVGYFSCLMFLSWVPEPVFFTSELEF